ncbi:DUF2946 domain-containing protein [Undibacterium sp. Ji49W]|uniref:DUF2946 domain-containing protein n=1 Tax=Undibacterium sp. Ji49W TaxID=3413040 RepID=UPI003BF29291
MFSGLFDCCNNYKCCNCRTHIYLFAREEKNSQLLENKFLIFLPADWHQASPSCHLGYNPAMRISYRLRHFTIWLACFALLFSGLLPSLATGMESSSAAAGRVSGLIELCSASGKKLLDTATGKIVKLAEDKSDQPKGHSFSHCGLCLPLNDHSVFLPPSFPERADSKFSEHFPPLFYHAPVTLTAWTHAQPRAPPVFHS